MEVTPASIFVDILTPAFSYPANVPRHEILSICQRDLGLGDHECEFIDIDNYRIGCILKNNKFSMEFVEQTYQHTVWLTEQLERSFEALRAFQEKIMRDQQSIEFLKSQLNNVGGDSWKGEDDTFWKLKYEEEFGRRRQLEDKLDRLRDDIMMDENNLSTPNSTPPPIIEHKITPRVVVPRLPLNNAPARSLSPTSYLRRNSSSSETIDTGSSSLSNSLSGSTGTEFVEIGPLSPPTLLRNSDHHGLKRRNTISNLKPLVDNQLDIPQDTFSQCRLCNCDVFRATKAGWICTCGHPNIKHSPSPYKQVSPRGAISPRGVGGALSPRTSLGGLG